LAQTNARDIVGEPKKPGPPPPQRVAAAADVGVEGAADADAGKGAAGAAAAAGGSGGGAVVVCCWQCQRGLPWQAGSIPARPLAGQQLKNKVPANRGQVC